MSKALTFIKHGLHAPTFHEYQSRHHGERKQDDANSDFNDVSRIPPRRTFQDFDVS
jgi:hypothetical protein